MNLIKIKETCLYVNDLKLAKAFYEGKLGLPVISYEPGKHLFLRAGASVLLCFNPDDARTKKSPPPHYGNGHQHFAFEVPDTEYNEAKAEVMSKGIKIIEEITWKRGVKSFYFEDPENNILEVLPETGIWD